MNDYLTMSYLVFFIAFCLHGFPYKQQVYHRGLKFINLWWFYAINLCKKVIINLWAIGTIKFMGYFAINLCKKTHHFL